MQFMFSVAPVKLVADSGAITALELAHETSYVREQHALGNIRQVWTRPGLGGACLLLEAADLESAIVIIENLPLYKSGRLTIESTVRVEPYPGLLGGL